MNLKISPIPAFQDNYIWLLEAGGTRTVAVVDPGDAAPVQTVLKARNLQLESILITHHHADHIGGVAELLAAFPGVPVHGPRSTRIACVTRPLDDGDSITIHGRDFQVMSVPGHTIDHIAYYAAPLGPDDPGILFCGDTLFAAGCGRLFEGTPAAMHASLARLAALSEDTRVYCAHEYTLANLRFARAVEPENEAIARRIEADSEARQAGIPTLPSTIALERRTNPFLRCHKEVVRNMALARSGRSNLDEVDVFAHLRQWKDNFVA